MDPEPLTPTQAVRRVARLPPDRAHDVIDVMCEAFHDYPVIRFVIGDEPGDRGQQVGLLVGQFVMARALRDEPLLGIFDGPELVAAATMSFSPSPPSAEADTFREKRWQELGTGPRERYDRCIRSWSTFKIDVPHVHLNMIGVRRRLRGAGLARLLLETAQQVSRETPGSEGVDLTTENPANLPIYRRVGYEVVGHARIAPELETWALFRRN